MGLNKFLHKSISWSLAKFHPNIFTVLAPIYSTNWLSMKNDCCHISQSSQHPSSYIHHTVPMISFTPYWIKYVILQRWKHWRNCKAQQFGSTCISAVCAHLTALGFPVFIYRSWEYCNYCNETTTLFVLSHREMSWIIDISISVF